MQETRVKSASMFVPALTGAHFESRVAKAVFNDRNQPPRNPVMQRAECVVMDWIESRAVPRSLMTVVPVIDRVLFPFMSPTMMRRFCRLVCEHIPQVLPNSPNTFAHVQALSRAVHMSKFLHPDALERILLAMEREGLAASSGRGGDCE